MTTYQPLDGLEGDGIVIASVTCYVHSISSAQNPSIGLISAENHPPTKSEHKPGDLNLASAYGIEFTQVDGGEKDATITLDTTTMKKAAEVTSMPDDGRENLIRACLECLRLTRPKEIAKLPIKLACKDEDRAWLEPIVKEFNEHDPDKAFFQVGS